MISSGMSNARLSETAGHQGDKTDFGIVAVEVPLSHLLSYVIYPMITGRIPPTTNHCRRASPDPITLKEFSEVFEKPLLPEIVLKKNLYSHLLTQPFQWCRSSGVPCQFPQQWHQIHGSRYCEPIIGPNDYVPYMWAVTAEASSCLTLMWPMSVMSLLGTSVGPQSSGGREVSTGPW